MTGVGSGMGSLAGRGGQNRGAIGSATAGIEIGRHVVGEIDYDAARLGVDRAFVFDAPVAQGLDRQGEQGGDMAALSVERKYVRIERRRLSFPSPLLPPEGRNRACAQKVGRFQSVGRGRRIARGRIVQRPRSDPRSCANYPARPGRSPSSPVRRGASRGAKAPCRASGAQGDGTQKGRAEAAAAAGQGCYKL